MSVKLISYSQSPQYPARSESALDLIAFCARVSNPSNQNVNVGGSFKVQGQDLVVALQRANRNRDRL